MWMGSAAFTPPGARPFGAGNLFNVANVANMMNANG